jgi:uncharacterized membrane protein YbhN (UPF0104 family)
MRDHDSAPSARGVGRSALLWIIKISVSGGLLYLLLERVDLGHLWDIARHASVPWLTAALGIYLVMILLSAWRWRLLLTAQGIGVSFGALTSSFLVATFLNNFFPSNIGGDVMRVRDTAGPAGSKTRATTVVLVDRGIGLLGLLFVAAAGATGAALASATLGPIGPGALWLALGVGVGLAAVPLLMPGSVGRLLAPLRALHQEWVEERIQRLTDALARFGRTPRALLACFVGAIAVQGILVVFYLSIVFAIGIDVSLSHLAIVVPVSLIVQMLPVSINGFGVREATFGFYFTRLGLPLESALALSFIGAALIMLFSTSGAVAYLIRGTRAAAA